MNRLHIHPPAVHALGDNAPTQTPPPHTPAGLQHAPAAGATWWQQQGVSKRCGVQCTAASCVLEHDERSRYWHDCPHAVCPDWKAAALGVAGLSDHEQVTEALRPATELTGEQLHQLAQDSVQAGMVARLELWRRNGVQP